MSGTKMPRRLLVIGNLYNDPVPKVALNKALRTWNKIYDYITVIDGESFGNEDDSDRLRKNFAVLIYKSIARQIRAITMMKNSEYDTCVILLPFLLFPVMYNKLRRKRSVLYIGGLASKSLIGEVRSGLYGKIFRYWLIRVIELLAFNLADTIIVDSDSSIKFFKMDRYRRKIRVYRDLVDHDTFNKSVKVSHRGKSIGYISRLSKEKGIIEFLRAISALARSDPGLSFIIGGSGVLSEYALDYVKSDKYLDGRTTFLGWVEPEKMPAVLNRLQLLVLPSYSEGTPNIVLESMACGTPILATPVGGIPDMIKDGVNGFIIRCNDDENRLAGQISEILSSDLETVSDKAREYIIKEHSEEAVTDSYRRIFDCAEYPGPV